MPLTAMRIDREKVGWEQIGFAYKVRIGNTNEDMGDSCVAACDRTKLSTEEARRVLNKLLLWIREFVKKDCRM